MSIADHFEHAPDARFVRSYDRGSASRQFRISLALVVIIAMAAMALGAIVRFDAPAGATADSQGIAPPAYVGKL